MVAEIFLEHNVEGRKERAPLGVLSYILNITGIIGNVLVLHVFRTRISRSLNYRTFVLFLAFVDLFTCISHIAKELNRMISVYNQLTDKDIPYRCETIHYLGNAVGVASFFIAMFITFERYRKICTPFKTQITTKHSRIICIFTVLVSFVFGFPAFLIHGKRNVVVEGINATRCSVKNEYDEVMLPFLYHVLIFATVVVCFAVVVAFQLKIRNALVKKTHSKKKMKYVNSAQKSESGNPAMVSENESAKNARKDKSKRKEASDDEDDKRNKRIAITFAIVSLILMVSFFTHTLYEFIKSMDRYFFPRQEISKMEDILEEYLPDIVTINGILNPFVYLFTDIQFRQELMKLCGRRM